MTDNVENLILEMLKGLRNELKSFRARYESDASDMKLRMTAIERGIGSMKRDSAEMYEDHARQQAAIDRLSERLDQVEKRLELS